MGICCNTATNAATFAMYSLRGIPFPDAISFVGHFCQRPTPIYNVFKKYYFVDSNSEDYGILFQRKMFMGGQLIRYILASFFQASLKQGTIPIDWTTANVVPIFKKGDRLQPINYRPISLTSITCKMLEHIITSNIMQHLDSHNILHDAQHGFRKHRSTETQLIQLIDNLAHNIDNRIQTDAILLDFQKAFDKVPHHRLLYKLKYYGISPQALNWVHSFLTNRTQQVLLEGNMSSSINVTSGVPQGSVLGPLLFLIYINDLPDYIQNNSTVKLFADDTIIYHPINNQQDSIALQEDLDSLQRWESDWLMHFHPQKCQTMHITNKRNIIQSTYTIHNHKLQTTNTAKYLGIHIHSTLNWNTHINKTA